MARQEHAPTDDSTVLAAQWWPDPAAGSGTGRPDLAPAPCAAARTWQSFVRAHALVTRRIEADLLAAHGLSLVSFEVLEHLDAAPGRRMRMAELADLLVVSRSGVTRAVDRLARQGLVGREPCDSDLRGTYAALTEQGRTRLAAAMPTHRAGVQHFLLEPLGPGLAGLADVLEPVLERAAVT